jgi:hypothetical protein
VVVVLSTRWELRHDAVAHCIHTDNRYTYIHIHTAHRQQIYICMSYIDIHTACTQSTDTFIHTLHAHRQQIHSYTHCMHTDNRYIHINICVLSYLRNLCAALYGACMCVCVCVCVHCVCVCIVCVCVCVCVCVLCVCVCESALCACCVRSCACT